MSESLEHVVSSDGARLAVWRAGSGPALLLVHGTTADHTRWRRVSAGFERHFTVYAMDRRGRGGSGDADAYSIEKEGDDVLAVAQSIGGPATLLGHSYGGLCCIEAAPRVSNLHRLILYEPPLPTDVTITPPEIRDRIDRLIEANDREGALLTFLREVVGVPEPQLDVMRSSPAWAGRLDAAHTVAREIRIETDYHPTLERLRSVTAPTLLLLGGESDFSFREATHKLSAFIPNSRIHEIPGQQHVAMDMNPDEFVEIVSSFILS